MTFLLQWAWNGYTWIMKNPNCHQVTKWLLKAILWIKWVLPNNAYNIDSFPNSISFDLQSAVRIWRKENHSFPRDVLFLISQQ